MNFESNIDLDRKCAECGKGGATGSGICLGCAAKILKRRSAKSEQGKVVLARFKAASGGTPLVAVGIAIGRREGGR